MSRAERFHIERTQEEHEGEPAPNVPIIDIIRHGQTSYKEFQDRDFTINPDAPDFQLDADHLDLTEEGIEKVSRTAVWLADTIDKDHEAIILVTSPQCRAQSTMLIIERTLKERGITVLNPIKELRVGLGEIPIRNKAGFGATWLEAHRAYGKAHPEVAHMMPEEVHEAVAASMGRDLSEIMAKSHTEIGDGFRRFFRHAVNIDRFLRDETKQVLEGKRLRIVCVTHEERIASFAKDALGLHGSVEKGGMLEVRPQGIIEAGGETAATVTLFGTSKEDERSAQVTIRFAPDNQE